MSKPDDGCSGAFEFVYEPGLNAARNLADFISKCKNGCERNQSWDDLTWPEVKFTKVTAPRNTRGIVAKEHLLEFGFREFAKAYLWYSKSHNSKFPISHHYMALRILEKALLDIKGKAIICRCSVQVLDHCVVIARNLYGSVHATAHQLISYVEKIANFLQLNGLSNFTLVGWRNPIKAPEKMRTVIGKQGDQYRRARLPDEQALDSIAEIFASDPQSPRDILVTSFMAMAMCAPSRAHELINLPVWAETSQTDKDGVIRYGWRFYSGKGFEGDIKWIPSSMETIAKIAFKRVMDLTRPGRQFARWMEDNPAKFFRHETCPEVDENLPLSIIEAARALGFQAKNRQQANTALKSRKLVALDDVHTLRSLSMHVFSRLPQSFPWCDKAKKVKYSEALFCILRNQAHATRITLPVGLQTLDAGFFTNDLSTRTGGTSHASIFERHGYKGDDGRALRLTTHQPRHLLNTIANRAGLSQEYIAKWSGRASISQNRVYNHATDSEVLGKVSEVIIASSSLSLNHGGVRSIVPLQDGDFEGIVTPASHVTESGFCVHNFIISPCMRYRDCDNCEDQVCVKGNTEALERAKLRLSRLETVLALAVAESNEEAIGADRWVAHHRLTIKRLKQFIELLTDESLPDGSLIRLAGGGYSLVQRAINNVIGKVIREEI